MLYAQAMHGAYWIMWVRGERTLKGNCNKVIQRKRANCESSAKIQCILHECTSTQAQSAYGNDAVCLTTPFFAYFAHSPFVMRAFHQSTANARAYRAVTTHTHYTMVCDPGAATILINRLWYRSDPQECLSNTSGVAAASGFLLFFVFFQEMDESKSA